MKYNPEEKKVQFVDDMEVREFHDQLTELMRAAMSRVGDENTSDAQALKLTQDFFTRYAALTEMLSGLRAHLKRSSGR